jgi:Na+/melibiose symporter-like transporter
MEKLSIKTKCSYACCDLTCVLISHVVGNYFMFYCTNMIGLTLMAVGTIMFICRIWDAGNDLISGRWLAGRILHKERLALGCAGILYPLLWQPFLCLLHRTICQ